MSVGRHRIRIHRVIAGPLVIGWLASACGGGDLVLPRDGSAAAIRVVEGDGQSGSVGQALPAPVVIEVTNRDGEPVEGAAVEFVLTSAGFGGQVTPAAATTGADGRAEAHVLLGDKVGLQSGEARLQRPGSSPLSAGFSAVAFARNNQKPDADFDWNCDALACEFTDASSDDDGTVTGYSWDFGDGDTSADREPSHSYATAGTYTVTLSVTADGGATDARSEQVTATAPSTPPSEPPPTDPPEEPPPPPPPPPPPSNKAPKADFRVDCDDLRCGFTDRSEDEDGSVVRWQWSFGDGTTSSERNPSHSYSSSGRYDVRLVVTDDDGANDDRTRHAQADAPPPPEEPPPPPEEPPPPPEEPPPPPEEPPPPPEEPPPPPEEPPPPPEEPPPPPEEPPPPPPANKPPRAEFQVQCAELGCAFADRSTDEDGSVVSWRWEFGDGAGSSERNPSHTYDEPGRYEVLLVVTDDDGAAASKTHRAEPDGPAGNLPPKADFDVRCERGLTCSFTDKSKDDDGVITSWSWDFGDGATSSDRNPVHTYGERGRYDVVLTVTDDTGGSNTKSHHADPRD